MNILITGANGFVGKNLVENLKNIRDGKDKTRKISDDLNIFEYDTKESDSVFEAHKEYIDIHFVIIGEEKKRRSISG